MYIENENVLFKVHTTSITSILVGFTTVICILLADFWFDVQN